MYLVVRKDHAITMAEGMALAGAGSVRCADRFRDDDHWRDAFRDWTARPRKVALRATPEEFADLSNRFDSVCLESAFGPTLLALPPRRHDRVETELAALRPYTDPPRRARGEEDAETDDGVPLRYVIRHGVLRTTGKAMAQAGHAALMAADRL